MGHVLGVEKRIWLFAALGLRTPQAGRASEILSICGPEVSLGSLGVEIIHVQSPTPHTPPLPAYFGQFSHQCGPQNDE